MENPFEPIMEKLELIENQLKEVMKKLTATPLEDVQEIYTLAQLSEYLGIAKQTLYGYTHRRTIPHYKIGKKIVFKKSDIDKWIGVFKVRTLSELQQEANKHSIKKRYSN